MFNFVIRHFENRRKFSFFIMNNKNRQYSCPDCETDSKGCLWSIFIKGVILEFKVKMMNEGRVAALFVFFVVFCLYGLCVMTPVQVEAHAGDAPEVCCAVCV